MQKRGNVIIGTAGHVDHGKTCLIKALTGIDTDQLEEEKKRGITIETGFAYMDFSDGSRAGVIDVPGHERFIKNMLACSGSVDIALLVVAADDGVMPQTREHLDILRLLSVPKGIIVITKCDLVEKDWLQMVREDIEHEVTGTFLEGAPTAEVSVFTGQGIEELKSLIESEAALLIQKPSGKCFRLPIDRVFSMTGFGTVVTGTLLDGTFRAGDDAVIYPTMLPAKVRSIQIHSQTAAEALPGQRAAFNLPNLKKEQLNRGDVLAAPDSLKPTMMLDVRLNMLSSSPYTVKSGNRVHLYLGAKELVAKVILMEKGSLEGGESDYAQLRMTEPVTAKKGDHFVIRYFSPMITIGGGVVLDGAPLKRRRNKADILEQFETKETGDHLQRVELAVMERPGSFSSLRELTVRADLDRQRVKGDCNVLTKKGILIKIDDEVFIHKREMEQVERDLKKLLYEWHKSNPYSPGMSAEELRSRIVPKADKKTAQGLLRILEDRLLIEREGGFIRKKGFVPAVNEAENQLIDLLDRLYLDFGMTPKAASGVEPSSDPASERRRKSAFAVLLRSGKLIKLDDLYCIHKEHYDRAWEVFRRMAEKNQPVTLSQYRDALETSRKVAVALLENFDNRGLTVMEGEGRVLRNKS